MSAFYRPKIKFNFGKWIGRLSCLLFRCLWRDLDCHLKYYHTILFLNQRKNSKLEYYYLYKYRLHCTHQISLWTYQSLLYVCCYLFVIETYITYILYYLPTLLTYLLLNTFFHVCPFLIFKLSPPAQLLLKNLETKVFRSFLST